MTPIYYNENDKNAAAWLNELIRCGHLPSGEVDTRSIIDVRGEDLAGYRQCHFFAGIGGWPLALHLAGWPDDRAVWTASCPCQPFSAAGKRRGTADERHLWPEFRRLIAECAPATVFGEQVASKDGREWLAGVRADLEALGYAVGAADLCAAGAGAPHIRQRLFWLADTDEAGRCGASGSSIARLWAATERCCNTGGLADTERHGQPGNGREQECSLAGGGGAGDRTQGSTERPWSSNWLDCLDGKARRVEPGVFPLADGVPCRVGRLRGYGNAIVPQIAAEFILACRGIIG